ncbi:MAG: transposase [Candidatus Zixiibacteriota bacterium]
MGKWRTIDHPGAAYFVTSTVVDFTIIFDQKRYIDIIIKNLDFYRNKYHFKLYAFVIMPEHLHLIVHPFQESKIKDIMRDFKSYTSKEFTEKLKENSRFEILNRLKKFATPKIEHPFWTEGNRPVGIYTGKTLRSKIDYIHANPLRRGLVKNLEDYPYSSFRNYYLNDEALIKIDKDWF